MLRCCSSRFNLNLRSFSKYISNYESIYGLDAINSTSGRLINCFDRTFDVRNDRRVSLYANSGNVTLKAVTTSNLPRPYQQMPPGGKMPTHQNTLGESESLAQRIISSKIIDTHQRNSFGSSSPVMINGMIDKNINFGGMLITKRCMSSDVNNTLSRKDKLKKAVKEYGSTVIVFHVTISLISLGCFYMAVSSGIDPSRFLPSSLGSEATLNKIAAGTSTFVIAYAVHKVFAPARIGITLTATPFIVRYLRHIGFLKTPVKMNK